MSRRAGFWIRVAASLIDATLLLALVFAQAATLDAVWYRTYDIYRAQAAAAIVFYGGWLLYSSLEIWIAATVANCCSDCASRASTACLPIAGASFCAGRRSIFRSSRR